MDPGAVAPGSGDPPLSSAAAAAAEEEVLPCMRTTTYQYHQQQQQQQHQQPASRYESQKRRDWNTFLQYLQNHKPPLALPRCGGAHVVEFLKYLDQFGKTKVHAPGCAHFGRPSPPAPPCACPLRQAWGSLDALVGRLRAAYEENGGRPEANPLGTKAVRAYLREVKESQGKARGIPYEKKRKRRTATAAAVENSTAGTASGDAYSNTKERYCNL